MQGRPHFVLILVTVLVSACDFGTEGWGNEKLRGRIAALAPGQITEATIALDECPRNPKPLDQHTLANLLKQIAILTPAPEAGRREEWEEWRIVTLKTKAKEEFEISVATRRSLAGKPIVILEEKPSGGIGLYAGESFWQWLRATRESSDLDTSTRAQVPCISPQVFPAPSNSAVQPTPTAASSS